MDVELHRDQMVNLKVIRLKETVAHIKRAPANVCLFVSDVCLGVYVFARAARAMMLYERARALIKEAE